MGDKKKIRCHVEFKRVKDLKDFKKNPRYITKTQFKHLVQSFEESGYVEYIVIHPDNTIIAGHMRVKVMKHLGWKDEIIPVIVPDETPTEEEMERYCIRSNKNTGDWHWEMLANEWDIVKLHEWGFEAKDLEIMTQEMEDVNKELGGQPEKCPTCGQKIRRKK